MHCDVADPMKATPVFVVEGLLECHAFRYRTENDLQAVLAAELRRRFGAALRREVWISPTDRADFVIDHETRPLLIEVKIKGAETAVRAQMRRYREAFTGDVMLATTRRTHLRIPGAVLIRTAA
jgi:hypothetical protein